MPPNWIRWINRLWQCWSKHHPRTGTVQHGFLTWQDDDCGRLPERSSTCVARGVLQCAEPSTVRQSRHDFWNGNLRRHHPNLGDPSVDPVRPEVPFLECRGHPRSRHYRLPLQAKGERTSQEIGTCSLTLCEYHVLLTRPGKPTISV